MNVKLKRMNKYFIELTPIPIHGSGVQNHLSSEF